MLLMEMGTRRICTLFPAGWLGIDPCSSYTTQAITCNTPSPASQVPEKHNIAYLYIRSSCGFARGMAFPTIALDRQLCQHSYNKITLPLPASKLAQCMDNNSLLDMDPGRGAVGGRTVKF